jgi:hypothetical protein
MAMDFPPFQDWPTRRSFWRLDWISGYDTLADRQAGNSENPPEVGTFSLPLHLGNRCQIIVRMRDRLVMILIAG